MTMTRLISLTLLCLASGCPYLEEINDGSCAAVDLKGSPPADMAVAPPKCAAAAGLAGDNLLCVDFNQVSSLTDSKLAGWDFTSNCGAMSWTIASGQLQIKNFSTFASTCGFTMPPLTSADYQKYSRFTLSVVQSVDVNKLKQSVGIYLGVALDNQQVTSLTGTNPRQLNVYQIAKAALPNGGSGTYQPLFQITSGVMAGGTAQGWQIESIAVNATP